MQISRLFEIVYILLDKKTTTAKELSERFEVSTRTIYRDIETLCQSGIPIYTNRGNGGGICLVDNFILNKSILTKEEQNEILDALQSINAASYSDTSPILSKLSSLFQTKNPDWIEVDFSYWSSNEEDKLKFNVLKEAILSFNVISFTYYNSYGKESKRIVEPIKLLFKGQAWYLLGYCREKLDTRCFKISRIKDLSISEELFEVRPLEICKEGAPSAPTIDTIKLLIKVDVEMAYRIYDEFPPNSITRNDDGSFLIRAEMKADGWLYGYLMSYEDHIVILEPDYLREEMIIRYKNICKKYQI
ncbi:MAG TPA: YafY family protein [Mobilitalea sp.]|nr:YafY family protein [Mobilitalea sp.]